MAERKVSEVYPTDAASWRVERVDGPSINAHFPSREEAIRETQRFAAAHPPSVVRVHDRDGMVIEEFEYP